MSYSVVVNDYIGAIKRNMPHETTNYGPGKYILEVDYYRHTYFSAGKLAHTRKN